MIAPIMLALGARQIENKAAKAEYDRMTVLPWLVRMGNIQCGNDSAWC